MGEAVMLVIRLEAVVVVVVVVDRNGVIERDW